VSSVLNVPTSSQLQGQVPTVCLLKTVFSFSEATQEKVAFTSMIWQSLRPFRKNG